MKTTLSKSQALKALEKLLLPNGTAIGGTARQLVALGEQLNAIAQAMRQDKQHAQSLCYRDEDGSVTVLADYGERRLELSDRTGELLSQALADLDETIFDEIASEIRRVKRIAKRKRRVVGPDGVSRDVLLLKAAAERGRVNVYAVTKELVERATAGKRFRNQLEQKDFIERETDKISRDLFRRMKRLGLRSGG